MSRTIWFLMLVTSCFVANAASAQSGSAPKPKSVGRSTLHVVYFVPTDRRPEPEYRGRIERMLNDVQSFYRNGMNDRGYGPLTFELNRDAQGALRVYDVAAKGPMRDYDRKSAWKVRAEVKDSLRKQNVDLDREFVVVFQLLLDWQGNKTEEIGSYVGSGDHTHGTAWVYDDAKLDPANLASKEPGGFYNRPCSIGQFNTHYLGGLAHELGHAFGLPHDCESALERERFGRSLMGGGNHTYGQERRGEGKGAFLSPASALPLSVHPLFAPNVPASEKMTCRFAELRAEEAKRTLILSGRLTDGPRVVGMVARNDGVVPKDDYDAIAAATVVDAAGRFRVEIPDSKAGEFVMRLTAYGASGAKRSFAIPYVIERGGRPNLAPFAEHAPLLDATAAFQRNDRAVRSKS
ncbi:MAG: hypothetical protein QM811_27830 [Pirellulales bacterium]